MRTHLLAAAEHIPPYASPDSYCRIRGSELDYGRHSIALITHEEPIGKDLIDHVIQADLSDRKDGWREQLGVRRLTGDTFEVACLPFFTQGICHRDVVTVDDDQLVTAVVHKSGHQTIRVALVMKNQNDRDQIRELIQVRVTETGLPHEWLHVDYLAVDLPPGSDAGSLVHLLKHLSQTHNLHWEIDS
ncbi:DUF4265 domain-containing protein [Streptomyces sp. NPDC094447]|uniref:DUF4265 domain-containing protein n=1 Tax=Streptomyces sp. NPDC094447 TaxID=3366062 RepID=UPI0037FE6F6B